MEAAGGKKRRGRRRRHEEVQEDKNQNVKSEGSNNSGYDWMRAAGP